MTRTSCLSLFSCAALLVALSAAGCGSDSKPKPKDGGSGGAAGGTTGTAGSGGGGGSQGGTGGTVDVDGGGTGGATTDGATEGGAGGTGGTGGTPATDGGADRTGGTSGTGGTPATDGGADRTGGTTGMDAPAETIAPPPQCQAGEACTGTFTCNASTRCIQMEREVCHCVSGSLFCGPVACTPDGGVAPEVRPDVADPMACPQGIQTGDTCMGGTDRLCNTPCTGMRRRTCFCNPQQDEWTCLQPQRCM